VDDLDDWLLELASAPPRPVAPKHVAGYVVEGRPIAGGMGTVHRARDADGEPVAIKLLHSDIDRLPREVGALRTIRSDAVVPYVDHGVTGAGVAYLVMPWLEGPTLADRLDEGALSRPAPLARRLIDGVAAIHAAGFVHRDLKPANVILVDGDLERATLVDLGLARPQRGAQTLTHTGAVLGTVGYMSPEQTRGERLGPPADVFALGCILHETITGTPAFPGDSSAEVLRAIATEPPAPLPASPLTELVLACLAKAPDTRPTAEECAAALSARAC